jgi:FkbM family methyltransferase
MRFSRSVANRSGLLSKKSFTSVVILLPLIWLTTMALWTGFTSTVATHSPSTVRMGGGGTIKGAGLDGGVGAPISPLQVDCELLLATEVATASLPGSYLDDLFEVVRTTTPVPFNMSIYSSSIDRFVSGDIRTYGCWECEFVRRVVHALQRHPGAFLLDLGGNIGMMSLSAAAAGHDAYVWEPFRRNFLHLCRSVMANEGFVDRVHLFNRALSRQEAVVQFNSIGTSDNKGGIAVYKATTDLMEQVKNGTLLSAGAIPVVENVDFAHAVPLDSFLPWLPPRGRPLVVKVDVEGSELEALAGAMGYLEQHKGNILLATMEMNYPLMQEHPEDADAVVRFFLSSGMKAITREGPLADDWREWRDLPDRFDIMWVKPGEEYWQVQ